MSLKCRLVQVASAVGKNTVVGKMVLSGASRAIGQSADGVAGVGEGEQGATVLWELVPVCVCCVLFTGHVYLCCVQVPLR